ALGQALVPSPTASGGHDAARPGDHAAVFRPRMTHAVGRRMRAMPATALTCRLCGVKTRSRPSANRIWLSATIDIGTGGPFVKACVTQNWPMVAAQPTP